jgi:hypothetical protein
VRAARVTPDWSEMVSFLTDYVSLLTPFFTVTNPLKCTRGITPFPKCGRKSAYEKMRRKKYIRKSVTWECVKLSFSLRVPKIVIFVLSAQNDCFLLGHENEFLVETVRSRLQTHSNAPTKQSSFARNTNTIFSITAF